VSDYRLILRRLKREARRRLVNFKKIKQKLRAVDDEEKRKTKEELEVG
jgi:hypothetical protein